MSQRVPVVRQHEYFLEIASRADREFEDVLFGFNDDAIEVVDSVTDCDC